MAKVNQPLTSIALLLKQQEPLDVARIEKAAHSAFRDAPEPPKVFRVEPPRDGPQMFGIVLGPLSLGLISSNTTYVRDVDAVADQVSNFAAKMAVQSHTAWMSVDKMRECLLPDAVVVSMIGRLLGEFLGDNVAGLILLPEKKIIGYDYSLIPLFRQGRAVDGFTRPAPDRVVKSSATSALAAAAEEAKTRWPEFVHAFENRKPGNGFGVKKKFVVNGVSEHMWVEVQSLDGENICGVLANSPANIKELKLRDPVTLQFDEIEDWLCSIGRQQLGGFLD